MYCTHEKKIWEGSNIVWDSVSAMVQIRSDHRLLTMLITRRVSMIIGTLLHILKETGNTVGRGLSIDLCSEGCD